MCLHQQRRYHHVRRKLHNLGSTLELVHNVRLTVVPPFFLLVSDRVPSHEWLTVHNQRNTRNMGIVANVALYIMCVGCVSHSLERHGDFSARLERSVCTNTRMNKGLGQHPYNKLPILPDPTSSLVRGTQQGSNHAWSVESRTFRVRNGKCISPRPPLIRVKLPQVASVRFVPVISVPSMTGHGRVLSHALSLPTQTRCLLDLGSEEALSNCALSSPARAAAR